MRASLLPISAVVLALAGCRAAPNCPAGSCGTAVIGVAGDANSLFPPLSGNDVSMAVDAQLFLPLASMGLGMNTAGDSGFIPKLADRWHFEDSVTLVFHLDPRARWQDGAPVTAQDVAYTYDINTDTVVNAPGRPLLSSIASVTARDSADVVFRFTHAYSEQFYDATHLMDVLPKHLLDTIPRGQLASSYFASHPVGDGPYKFVSWKPNESIELAADTNFFLGRPGIARLIWRITPDVTTQLTQLRSGEIDIIAALVGPDQVGEAQKAPHIRLVEYPSGAYIYLAFNLRDPAHLNRPHPLLGSRALRQALTFGIDRQAIAHALLGNLGQIARGPTSPMVWIWNDTLTQFPYDTVRARQMLDSLGWHAGPDGVRRKDGRPLSFGLLFPTSSASRMRAAVIIQAELKAIGVDLKLHPTELNTVGARAAAGQFDAMLGGWLIDPVPSAMRQFWTTEAIGGDNFGGYSDPRFDSLVAAASAARTQAAARPLWDAAMRVINDDVPAIWLYTPTMVAAVSDRFENVTIRPDNWAATLWTWRIAPGRALPRDRLGGR